MVYVQVKLQRNSHFQTAWIEKKKKVCVGCRVKLKEDNKFWIVKELYSEMNQSKLLSKAEMDKDFGASLMN